MFKNEFGKTIFEHKYMNVEGGCKSWNRLAAILVDRVCQPFLPETIRYNIYSYIRDMKFIPAGRYLYYAGREAAFFNNCFAMIAEDSREGWANLASNHMMALMCGGGVGTYYGRIRPKNEPVHKTGGIASGPVPLMSAMNEIGRNVMQGGSRRSALYASLPFWHKDIDTFMEAKLWSPEVREAKNADFNYPAPFDCTNMSVVYDRFIGEDTRDVLRRNVQLAMKTGEPGMQFDINAPGECTRNACTEFISDQDSDMCNLGSVNLGRIENPDDACRAAYFGSLFLMCGSMMAELPYEKCYYVRKHHRKIGLGIMGLHEHLIKAGQPYAPSDYLGKLLDYWREGCDAGVRLFSIKNEIALPERTRAIAPSGTISLVAGTTSGIEPLFATSMKRRFFDKGVWKYQYVVDPVALDLSQLGIRVQDMETSFDLAKDIERRIRMQAFIQRYVDMGISSTINLPAWGTEYNNESRIDEVTDLIIRYSDQLRGLTFYPDGSRGGQPLTQCDWDEALKNQGKTFTENLKTLEESSCKGGVCGI